MKQSLNILIAMAITIGMLAISPTRIAHADTLTVTNTNEDGPGSLRDAIINANNGDIIDATGISGTITITYTIFVGNSVTINGPGADRLIISGNNAVGVFYINTGTTVQINNLTIADGKMVDADGAGIRNFGDLTLNNVLVTNNHAIKDVSDYLRGGGIYNHDNASLTVTNSTISNNSAVQNGGGIHVGFNGSVTLDNVVISDNSLSYYGSAGGGISIRQGTTATLNNVSITNNSALNEGGGLYSDASLSLANSLVAGNTIGTDSNDTGGYGGGISLSGIGETYHLRNVTVSGNTALDMSDHAYGGGISLLQGTLNLNNATIANNSSENSGGGLYIGGGSTANIGNSIISGNNSSNTTSEDCAGTINSLGYNLIQDPTGCTIDGSIIGVLISLDPMLGALADNGGPTKTHALSVNSPAVDAADTLTAEPKDQRGFNRPQGGASDMGAYELRKGKIVYRSNNAQDGWILESGENTNAGGIKDNMATTFRIGDDATRKQYRGLLSFNTSTLNDSAVITKVTLKVKRESIVGGGNPVTAFQGFMVDIRKGMFGNSSLQITDWGAAAGKTAGPFTVAVSGGWYTFNLTSLKPYINKLSTNGGLTQIRLRFQLDDNNNFIANYLSLYSGNAPTASRPQLIIEYYIP